MQRKQKMFTTYNKLMVVNFCIGKRSKECKDDKQAK